LRIHHRERTRFLFLDLVVDDGKWLQTVVETG